MHNNLALYTSSKSTIFFANVLRSVDSKGLYDGKGKRNLQGQNS